MEWHVASASPYLVIFIPTQLVIYLVRKYQMRQRCQNFALLPPHRAVKKNDDGGCLFDCSVLYLIH